MFLIAILLAVQTDPLQQGLQHYAAGRPVEAIAPLRQALKLNPGLARAQDALAASLAETGQCKEALPGLKKAAARATDRDFQRAVEVDGVRCAMTLNDTNEALRFLGLLNRDFPDDPAVLYLKVHVYSDLSIRASQELVVKAPASDEIHELNAEAMETQGKWDEAAAEYRRVLERDPKIRGIHYRIGRLLLSQPKTEATLAQARHEFEEELKVNPSHPGAEFVLAELARQANNLDEAIERFSRVTKLDAGFVDAYMGLGRSLVSAHRAAEAVPPLETAVKLQPENPEAHYLLAIAYSRAGRKQDSQREAALHRDMLEKARRATDDVQKGVQGIQDPARPQ